MNYRSLWAKTNPYHPLWQHLLDVAAVCEALMPRFGGVPPLPKAWVLYLVALHDLGKADPVFQMKDADLWQSLQAEGFFSDWKPEKFRHEARSAQWLRSHLKNSGWNPTYVIPVVAAAIRGHHGDFNAPNPYSEDKLTAQNEQWYPLREEIAAMLREVLGVEPFMLERFDHASVTGIQLSGLIVLSDWIASNHELYDYVALDERYKTKTSVTEKDYYLSAQAEARHALQRLALHPPVFVASTESIREMDFGHLFGLKTLRPSQIVLEQLCKEGFAPGLLILEAPMGEGKTEGALFVSEYWRRNFGRTGAYLGLPTMATSNQMHTRYQDFIETVHPEAIKPRLIHGMAWLIEEDTPTTPPQIDDGGTENDLPAADALDWFRNAKRALLAPEGVGTVDQALRAGLNVKHGFLRLFGLRNRVLIVDEVHAYDEYMTTILERLLIWCRDLEIPVVLLSATLSRRQKARLIEAYGGSPLPSLSPNERDAYPLITVTPLTTGETRAIPVPTEPGIRRVHLEHHRGMLGDSDAVARLALTEVKDGGCACVLANTVKEAQEIYRALKKLTDDFPDPEPPELMLYHSRFRAEVRQEIEQKVLSRFGKPVNLEHEAHEMSLIRPACILVATQVVEQSLDVDFDVFFSQLAPIDLLLQRSGRLHRHPRVRPARHQSPVLHLLLPSPEKISTFGGTGRVYEHEPLYRTLILLENRNEFLLPDEFRELIETCYSDEVLASSLITPEMLSSAKQTREKKNKDHVNKAKEGLTPEPKIKDFTLAKDPHTKREDEEGTEASYLIAKTRLDDDTLTALVLTDPHQIAQARAKKSPSREALKSLFLQKVGLPGYWLTEVETEEGYEPLTEGEKWLRNHRVLILKEQNRTGRDRQGNPITLTEKIWRGRDKQGNLITITDDPELGVVYWKGDTID